MPAANLPSAREPHGGFRSGSVNDSGRGSTGISLRKSHGLGQMVRPALDIDGNPFLPRPGLLELANRVPGPHERG